MATRLGIDDAGRGCVLGPMFFGACLVDAADEPALTALGVRDSKRLSAKRREALRREVQARAIGWQVTAIGVDELDTASLNELGKRAIVDLVQALRPDIVVLDSPVAPPGIPRYRADVLQRLAAVGIRDVRVVAENKADDNHPCCAAASILAKTSRDAALAELQGETSFDFGSGYPSDPKTKAFIERCWRRDGRFPPFVRRKWETVRRIMASGDQPRLF